MTDWIEHNGGPQPVGDNVWVEVNDRVEGYFVDLAQGVDWIEAQGYRILNQHVIDAARIEGIRLGLEAAGSLVWKDTRWVGSDGPGIGEKLCRNIRALDPETIARDCLIKPAQSDLPPSSSDTIAKEAQHD